MKSLAGHLLLAVPDLEDPNFFRSVVLILHHDQFGASGVVLNRPTDVSAREAWSDEENGDYDADVSEDLFVYVGGPVEGPLILLHQDRDLSEETVLPGVFLSTRRDAVERLVRLEDCAVRLFAGHSGWGPQQLEGEIEQGVWLTIAADEFHIFSDAETLWQRACKSFGDQIVAAPLHGPSHPGLN